MLVNGRVFLHAPPCLKCWLTPLHPLFIVRELTEDDKEEILASEKFCDFFMQASRLMERALDEDTDIFMDYSGADRQDTGKSQELIKLQRAFFDERWSANRIVTALDWSSVYPELLLGAYDANEEAKNEPQGVCLIWNLKYKKTTPEYVFNFQTAITAAILSEFHPSLVIGGTYAGQIVLWDTRVDNPVLCDGDVYSKRPRLLFRDISR
ncbi:unnamed protein product [Dibothriocephalus latus]|uniref:Uncharacterized protein n=1 Tax=Dibothriocephalus latus TaxID=60516 RepID=A0A3P7P0J2_DIBLA|nr:unnamed protein product [Dibothriocephalus latus]